MHTETRDAAAVVDTVIRSRKTVRAFRPDPVPQAQLVEIIEVARMAPSNFNTQPWRVHVLAGKAKRALSEAISRVHSANTHAPFSPFPQPPPPDCATRLDDFGRRYYTALGIDRADMASRAPDRPQLLVLRCANRFHLHHRFRTNEAQLARFWPLPPEHDARRPRPRLGDLPTGHFRTLPVHNRRAVKACARGSGDLRDVARLCG